jgi:hypothetical protein
MRLELFGLRIDISTAAERATRRPLIEHKPAPNPDEEASEDFWSSFCGGGTIVAQCACGRTTFAADTTMDYDDGELEGLLAKATAEPDKYMGDFNNDSVSVIDMPGGLIIWGCPCHKAKQYEDFLVSYRRETMEFYKRLVKKATRRSAEMEESLAAAKGGEE